MNELIDATLKTSLVLAMSLAALVFLRHRSAAARHWVLTIAVACSLAMPLATAIVPSWSLAPAREQLVTNVATTLTFGDRSDTQQAAQAERPPRVNIGALAILVWTTGVALNLLVLVAGMAHLAWVARRARSDQSEWSKLLNALSTEAHLRRRVTLLQSDHPRLLVTWGLARPKVLLPAAALGWSDHCRRIVLRHELAHISRGDWASQMAAAVLRALYWFNPLVWIACRRLRQESERACDDAVLAAGVEGADYAAHLVELARKLNSTRYGWLPAPAMARASSLEGRIHAMLNTNIDRLTPSRRARAAGAIVLLIATLVMAGYGTQKAAAANASPQPARSVVQRAELKTEPAIARTPAENPIKALTASAASMGQSFFRFAGSVLDSTGRAVPGTRVMLMNTRTSAKYEVTSDGSGHFEFVGLPSSEYALEARMPGFLVLKDSVAIAGNLDRNLELQIGELEETITVTNGPKPSPLSAEDLRALQQRAENIRAAKLGSCQVSDSLGGRIVQPVMLFNVRPQYPELLKATKVGGIVKMDAVIGVDGIIRDVRTISSPDPDLEQAAVEAVRQWQYSVTLLNCEPVEVHMTVTANFVPAP
jgi:TonB family protein